jgi:hypothetical protein
MSLAGRFALFLKYSFCFKPVFFGSSVTTTAILPQRKCCNFDGAPEIDDCKGLGPVIARLLPKYKDLRVVAPTQLYGYIGREENVPADKERAFIEKTWMENYGDLAAPDPISAETMQRYGVSTTPTLVFIDRNGIVRRYHSGRLTEAALDREFASLIR